MLSYDNFEKKKRKRKKKNPDAASSLTRRRKYFYLRGGIGQETRWQKVSVRPRVQHQKERASPYRSSGALQKDDREVYTCEACLFSFVA